jgi:hypothetical protein
MPKLCKCGSPYGTLDAGAHDVRGHFRASDVIGKAFQRVLCLFELGRGELCGLKQASDFVKGR